MRKLAPAAAALLLLAACDPDYVVHHVGWFFMWFLLFVKNFPAVSISEVKEVLAPPRRKASRAHA